jgi:hypothetical protein
MLTLGRWARFSEGYRVLVHAPILIFYRPHIAGHGHCRQALLRLRRNFIPKGDLIR